MRQLPPSRASSGYTPNRLNPLSAALVSDQGQRLTDIQAIQRLFANGEQGGYWPADPAYLYEDSAGTTPASVNGVVGLRVNRIAGQPNASQATTANKPYLRRTLVSNKTWLDSNTATGALTATFSSSLGSACTIATVGAEGVSILEGQTITTTYNIATAYGYNGDILIINRTLTAAEKALVTRVLGRNVPTLGSELVTNGGFDYGGDGWSQSNDMPWTFENGVATSNGGIGLLTSLQFAIQNAPYFTKATIVTRSSGTFYLPYEGNGLSVVPKSAPGSYANVFIARTSTVIRGGYSNSFVGSVDNISVRRIL